MIFSSCLLAFLSFSFQKKKNSKLFVKIYKCVHQKNMNTEYGRSCKDIGCLPREVCVMAYDSCSFNQQENVSCGRYPTCKKVTDVQGGGMANGGNTQQNSGNLS